MTLRLAFAAALLIAMPALATEIHCDGNEAMLKNYLEMFDKVDANHDGTISPAEHDAARATMRAKWKEMRGQRDKD